MCLVSGLFLQGLFGFVSRLASSGHLRIWFGASFLEGLFGFCLWLKLLQGLFWVVFWAVGGFPWVAFRAWFRSGLIGFGLGAWLLEG